MNHAPQRSWLSVRWRQLRNPPEPILRAVVANLGVAIVGALALLGYDLALARGTHLPGGDLRTGALAGYVLLVLVAGSLLTYRWVLLPAGAGGTRRRSAWSALLGLFAGLPIAYVVLVVAFELIRPLVR
jgi:hypothetical protein